MTSYTDVFGGSTVQAADVQFRAVALSASIVTAWPAFATTGNECARIMKVTPSAGSLTVTLPDATLTSAGMDVLFDNPSATTFTVLDSAGGVVATVAGGEVKYFYLSDSSTAAGTWRVTLFGVGASSVDAGQLAGYGLKALTSTLNFAPVVTQVSSNTVVSLSDRAKVFVWVGGSGTLTLPTTAGSTSDFSVEVHNQGTGTLTVATTGGVLVDGSATISLVVNESCFIHMGSADWYTVGRGRNTQFNFTQLNKVVTGGTVNLTLTEASNVVQTFTGTLLSNQTVNQPAVVQVYYVSNATSGAYTLTFGCVAGGTTVAVAQSQAAILLCDGTNIINANTSLAGGIATIIFGAGSAAAPSIALNTADTGFYSSGSDEIGVSNNGVYAGKFTTGGFKTELAGAAAVQAISSGSTAGLIADRPAGSVGSVRLRTSGTDRWSIEETATAESGANAGSNLALNAYSDAGALLGTALTAVRSTQVATFTQPPVLVGTNITGVPISTGVSGLGTGVATFLATPSSANLAAALTDETGTGANVFANSPTLVTPALGTPSALVGTNITGTAAGLTAGNVTTNANLTGHVTSVGNSAVLGSFTSAQLATALTDETGSGANVFATSPTLVTPILGVATGTSFQGIIGNVTPAAGTFTTLTSTSNSALGDSETGDTHAIKGATTLLASSASAALTVTQTGAGNAFVVEDLASTDSTPFVINAAGIVNVAHPTAITGALSSVMHLQVAKTDNEAIGAYLFNASSSGPALEFGQSNNATVGSHTVVASGDSLGVIRFVGSDGTNFIRGAQIICSVDGTPGPNDMPGRLVFSTTADGASSPTERMRIDSAGNVGIGGSSTAGVKVDVGGTYGSTSAESYGMYVRGTVPSATTGSAYGIVSQQNTEDAAFTVTNLRHFTAFQGIITGGSRTAPTSQIGYYADPGLTGATSNYGFYGNIPAGANRYNFYAAGTADNYFAGKVGIGIAPVASTGIYQLQGPTGAVTCYGHLSTQNIQSDVTTSFRGFQTNIGTAAAAFTISSVNHFVALQATVGASSAMTNQFGFISASANIGATSNFGFTAENTAAVTAGKSAYGFYSAVNIATGGGTTYGFYAAGTAANYFGGNVTVGGGGTLGYGAGSGGTVTQATSKATAVTLNKPSGQITMAADSLAAGASALFLVNNTAAGASDSIVANVSFLFAKYDVEAGTPGVGSFYLRVTNITGGSLSEAPVINFNVIKGSAS